MQDKIVFTNEIVDATAELAEQFWSLKRQLKQIEFEFSKLAHRIRSSCSDGEQGDREFLAWCEQHLQMSDVQAREFITRAHAVEIVDDERTYARVAPTRFVMYRLAELGRQEQVVVLETAKAQRKNAVTVMRELGHESAAKPSPYKDAARLAAYFAEHAEHIRDAPSWVHEIVDRYVGARDLAA